MRFVCVSDTHGQHWNLSIPKGDVFIFCGDAEINSPEALRDFNIWLGSIPCTEKIFIAGNHDIYLPSLSFTEIQMTFTNAIYLENSSCEINGIKFWGSPYSKEFNGWRFMAYDHELKEIWDNIPKDIDIAIIHGPSFGILDQVGWKNQGSQTLRNRLDELNINVVIVGHIHEQGGKHYTNYKTEYYNVSVLNEKYELTHPPTEIYYDK